MGCCVFSRYLPEYNSCHLIWKSMSIWKWWGYLCRWWIRKASSMTRMWFLWLFVPIRWSLILRLFFFNRLFGDLVDRYLTRYHRDSILLTRLAGQTFGATALGCISYIYAILTQLFANRYAWNILTLLIFLLSLF